MALGRSFIRGPPGTPPPSCGVEDDDRRDRSILFWKSLPISDRDTVLSKVFTALVLAPVVTFVIGIVTAFVIVLLTMFGAGFFGVHIVGLVLSNPAFWIAPFQILGLLPVYALWALPTVGYLLLVSSWAKSKVFLWAVGVPLLVLALLRWVSFMTSSFMNVGIDVFTQISDLIDKSDLGRQERIRGVLDQFGTLA